jgi:hypothetical protein
MQMFDVSFVKASASGTIGVLVRQSCELRKPSISDFNPDAVYDSKRHRQKKVTNTKRRFVQVGFRHPGKRHRGKKTNQTAAPSAMDPIQLSAVIKTVCLATCLPSIQVQQRQINIVSQSILDVDPKSHGHSNQTLKSSSRIAPSFV